MTDMSANVLIVDDDPHIRQLLSFAFGKAGIETREAGDGEAALEQVGASAPDLIILDINMPRMDGLEVCRRVRADSEIPILFLSSRDEELDRVLGIEMGADDYVTKPFSPREVVARAKAIIRRTAGRPSDAKGETSAAASGTVIQHGELSLDTEAWVARWREQEVSLTVTEFSLIKTLLSGPARIFTRDQLIDRLHGPGFAITDRTIDSHIRNVRRKFADVGGHDLVETRAGLGYRIGACVGGNATA